MKKKQEILIVRITKAEKKIIDELRETESINVSALVRKLIREHYEKKQNK